MSNPSDGGRVALVTGAGRGIGAGVARLLVEQGHRVALTARSENELRELAADVGGRTLVVPADLSDPAAADAVFDTVEAEWGPVEILIANAGVASSSPVHRTTDEEWARVLEINLTAPFRCVRRVVPGMKAAGWGRIVVVASMLSRVGEPYTAAYTASKHGVLGLVRAAAAELVRTGVTVNAVCPAYVDTPMTDANVERLAATTRLDAAQARRYFAERQPIGRLITVEEVVEAVRFCLANGALTGQAVNVDGGLVQS
ncbi:MAG: SDR family NAD(P)-dependent oxidoreductase [bacterium]